MKIRSDFVTNSSSSSFIIAYNSPSELVKDVNKYVEKYKDDEWSHQYKDVVYDIFNNRITYKEAVTKLKEFLKGEAFYESNKHPELRSKYSSWDAWLNSSDFKKIEKEVVERGLAKFENEVNHRGFFSLLQYSTSDGYYEVENDLPEMLSGVKYTHREH